MINITPSYQTFRLQNHAHEIQVHSHTTYLNQSQLSDHTCSGELFINQTVELPSKELQDGKVFLHLKELLDIESEFEPQIFTYEQTVEIKGDKTGLNGMRTKGIITPFTITSPLSQPIVTVFKNGKVFIRDLKAIDSAAMTFWSAVTSHSPEHLMACMKDMLDGINTAIEQCDCKNRSCPTCKTLYHASQTTRRKNAELMMDSTGGDMEYVKVEIDIDDLNNRYFGVDND